MVPVLGVTVGGGAVDVGRDDVGDHVLDLLAQVLALQHPAALGVDHLALLVHHLVVLEDVLADLHVLLLDLRLSALDRPGDHLVLDRHVVGQAHGGHDALDHGGVEAPHQLVAQRQVEARLTRVTLTTGATPQLVVDAPRLVPLGAEHVEAAGLQDRLGLLLALGGDLLQHLRPGGLVLLGVLHRVETAVAQHLVGDDVGVATEHDVGASTGHVRRDRDRASAARLSDDERLAVVLLRVQDLVRHTALEQQLRQVLGLLDARRADEDRLTLLVPLGDVVGDRLELRFLGLVDEVGLVDSHHRAVGRDRDDTQLVGLVELRRLGLGGTRHAGELLVEAEVVLQRDRGERLVLGLDLDAFLRLDRLVHALVEPAPGEDAARELVDDEHLAVADDVLLVLAVELLGLEGVVEEPDQRRVRGLVEVLDTELVLDELHTELGDTHGALALVHLVVDVLLHERRDPRELDVPAGRLVGRAGDNQRRPGLVDEDRVDLVDDGEVVPALHAVVEAPRHVVAQVVEAELVVRPVGDVGGVRALALGGRQLGPDDTDLQPEEPVHPAHPLGVTLCQVVVRGDDVHALAGQRVEVDGQKAGERLALTGLHLGDLAEMQRRATHQLDVVMPLTENARRGLSHHGEGFRQQFVQRLAVGVPFPELVGLRLQLGVRKVLDVVFEGVDVIGDAA